LFNFQWSSDSLKFFIVQYVVCRLPCYFVCTKQIETGKYTIILVKETKSKDFIQIDKSVLKIVLHSSPGMLNFLWFKQKVLFFFPAYSKIGFFWLLVLEIKSLFIQNIQGWLSKKNTRCEDTSW